MKQVELYNHPLVSFEPNDSPGRVNVASKKVRLGNLQPATHADEAITLGQLLSGGSGLDSIEVDTVVEKTPNAGVTVDGVLLKDGTVKTVDGLVGAVAIKVGADGTGLYRISATQLGVAVGGVLIALFDADSFNVDILSEKTTGLGILVDGLLAKDGISILKPVPVAINADATATAAEIASGNITSTSAAATAITTPTATAISTELGIGAGASFDLVVDNSAGANIVTMTLDGSITVITAVLTGAATLTVAAGTVGIFRLYFISAAVAKISRIA